MRHRRLKGKINVIGVDLPLNLPLREGSLSSSKGGGEQNMFRHGWSVALKALKYLCINHGDQRVIFNL